MASDPCRRLTDGRLDRSARPSAKRPLQYALPDAEIAGAQLSSWFLFGQLIDLGSSPRVVPPVSRAGIFPQVPGVCRPPNESAIVAYTLPSCYPNRATEGWAHGLPLSQWWARQGLNL